MTVRYQEREEKSSEGIQPRAWRFVVSLGFVHICQGCCTRSFCLASSTSSSLPPPPFKSPPAARRIRTSPLPPLDRVRPPIQSHLPSPLRSLVPFEFLAFSPRGHSPPRI